MPLTSQEIDELLSGPHIAVVSTIKPDGQPHAVPTWYDYADKEIVFHTGLRSRKYRNLRRNNRITVCVDIRTPPYKAVVIEGKAEVTVGHDGERRRRMAVKYLGEERGRRYLERMGDGEVVIVRVKPDKIISWDYGRGDNP